MSQVIRELEVASVGATSEPRPGPRPGIVFFPCARCRTSVDVARVRKAGAPLCERHRRG
jgi:hypothetical protein